MHAAMHRPGIHRGSDFVDKWRFLGAPLVRFLPVIRVKSYQIQPQIQKKAPLNLQMFGKTGFKYNNWYFVAEHF